MSTAFVTTFFPTTTSFFVRPLSLSSSSPTSHQHISTRRWTCISPPSPPPPAPTPPSPSSPADPFNNPTISTSTSPPSTSAPLVADPSSFPVSSVAPVFAPAHQPPAFPARERVTTALACTAGFARAVVDTNPGILSSSVTSITTSSTAITSVLKVTLPHVVVAALAVTLAHVFAVGVHHAVCAKHEGQQVKIGSALASGIVGVGVVAKMFQPVTLVLYCIGMTLNVIKPLFQCSTSTTSAPNVTSRSTGVAVPVPADVQGPLACLRSLAWNMLFYTAAKTALGGSLAFTGMTSLLSSAAAPFLFLAAAIAVFTAASTVISQSATAISTVKPNRTVGVVHALLGLGYAGAVLAAGLTPQGMFHRSVFGVGHTALGLGFIAYMAGVWPSSRESVEKFYAFVGTMMQAEYILLPFI